MISSLSFLWKYLKVYKWQILISFVAIIIITAAILGLGVALKLLIDNGFASKNVANLNNAFFIITVIVILLSFASYLRSYQVNNICNELEQKIKKSAFSKLVNISPSYFENHKVSDIASRLTSDLSLVTNTITMIASYTLRNITMAIGGLIMLLIGSFKLTSYVLLLMPIVIIPIIIVGKKIRQISKDYQNNISSSNGYLEERLSFIKTIQAFNNENYEINNYNEQLAKASALAKKRIHLRSIFFAISIALILLAITFVLWVGGNDVLNGSISAGSLSSFIFYSIITATSFGAISEIYGDIQRAFGALERIIEVCEAVSPIEENNRSDKHLAQIIEEISFKNVSFSYPTRPDLQVLKDLNISIKGNSKVALVGPSGGGKSTIFQLLMRFFDVNSGKITLNGVDISEISFYELRKNFAYVSQDPVIFSASAYDNILYGKLDASEEEVIKAAKNAEIYDFLTSLPQGLNTYLGERGMQISGGQKQRIAIARAFLRNPKVLLLDEPTSSLDNENERLVQIALDKLKSNRTMIVIAHRLSTIKESDMIFLVNEGKIVSQGTHAELIQNSVLYQKLYQEN